MVSENVTEAECPRGFELVDTLILANNNFHFMPLPICGMPHLSVLDLSHNRLKKLPPPNFWQCSLTKLDLSNNFLESHTEVFVMPDRDVFDDDDDE